MPLNLTGDAGTFWDRQPPGWQKAGHETGDPFKIQFPIRLI